ncbi:hypothetical protein F4818DRAFT_449154 [Hypoxylon cercidicola]|nr:hypothetical protein F4818DRAFT_449154 [Hypoxylon cercidicola]
MEPELRIDLRSTSSAPSFRSTSDRPESIQSTALRGRSRRHGLLKLLESDTSVDQSTKDVPAPPILTPGSPEPAGESIATRSQEIPITDDTEPPEKIGPEPTTQPPDDEEPHHIGLAKGADIDDVVAVKRNSSVRTPPRTPSPDETADIALTGRTLCRLTGGDLCEEIADVPDHICGNHKSATKGSGLSTHPNDIHGGHVDVQKIKPYHESSATTFKAEGNSIRKLAVEKQTNRSQEKESSNATSYWDFLPRFGQIRNEDTSATDEPRDHANTQANRKAAHSSSSKSKDRSVTLSRASQKSLEAVSKAFAKMTAELTSNQENVRHDDESAMLLGKAFGNSHPKERSALQEREKGAKVLTSDVSPTSYPHLVKSDRRESEQGSLPEKIDPRRAAAWLRQLLGYPESRSNTNYTQLPEKSHPRHQEHDDYPNDSDNAVSSRVTTFSGENAADAGAMETAMHHLERLLSEALILANQVTEQDQDQCGYVNNEELLSYLRNISEEVHESPNQPSVRESIATHSTFVDAIEGVSHDCSVFPSASAKLQRLAKPNIRSGNIRLHHVSEGDCVLPMPPPDKNLERRCLTPMPQAYDEDDPIGIIQPRMKGVPNSREVREYIRVFHQPPITPRQSSRNLRKASREADAQPHQSGTSSGVVDFSTQYNYSERHGTEVPDFGGLPHGHSHNTATAKAGASQQRAPPKPTHEVRNISLRRRSHVSIRDGERFSLTRSVKRQPTIARDWSPVRKRFVASVACISTALIGVLIGIYAGLVPSIQYYIADFHHYSILGNVGMYLGMALSTFCCWPLPLLHGRKPYILCSLCVAMPLLFPQAIAVSVPRSPYTSVWRWALLLSRAVMGCALGFASMNFHSMLTDLFGASLMSSNPHQEIVDYHDVRRHGGGLGIWLGVWTWCYIGSLGVGFLAGALVIDTLRPSWGLYISIMLIAVVLFLNVLCPEVRRSGWRYSVAEVRMGSAVSRRIARGEIMMHRVKDGPKWWGQEMYHGVALSLEMLRQPGFVMMAVYSAWIYAQVVLIIVLLGSLASRSYHFRSPFVGAAVSSVAVGALAAVPFQMANIFSRFRSTGPVTNNMTFDRKVTWTSHLVRRAIFVIVLPIAAGWNTIHSIGFIFAAGATGIGGIATRSLGQRAATGIVASILFVHSVLLLVVFARFRRVQIIPNSKSMEMDKWTQERRDSLRRRASAIAAAKASGIKDVTEIAEEDFRRMNILELGSLTRWSEIRKKNRLIDEGVHLNRQTVDLARDEFGRRRDEFIGDISDIVRKVSKRSKRSLRSMRSKQSHDSDHEDHIELENIGPLSHAGAGLEHQHATLPRDVYLERECIMGQTVPEEAEELSSMNGGSDDDYGHNRMQGHSSHITSKVQPYAGFERQELRGSRLGTGDYVINMDASGGRDVSVADPEVMPTDPDALEHRGEHGAHVGNKVRPADTGFESMSQGHGAHTYESLSAEIRRR